MTIHIPFTHVISVKIEDFIAQCDETALNELILLAEKKLSTMNQYAKVVKSVPMINHSNALF